MTLPPSITNEALPFLTQLTAAYWPDPDLRLEIRCLLDNTAGRRTFGPRDWYHLDEVGLSKAAGDAAKWRDWWNVYMGVLPRTGLTGKAENVDYTAWLWADIDGGEGTVNDAFNLVRAADIPRPHMAVLSGGGAHCYWRLKNAVTLTSDQDRACFKDLLRRLVLAIGGTPPAAHADGCRADCASILRIPGTYNHKGGKKRLVRLVHCVPSAPAEPVEWWSAHLPALPSPPPRNEPVRAYNCAGAPAWAVRWSETPAPEGTRHHELLTMAARLKRDLAVPESAIVPLLLRKAEVSSGSRIITEREIEDIRRWA